MFNFARNLLRSPKGYLREFSFSRPLILLQSDDWGRVGVRDKEGRDELRENGIALGQHPYDSYTLETADDLRALSALLSSRRDSTGRSACIVMNFLVANLDFTQMAANGYRETHLLPLSKGLPAGWKRPGLFEAYAQGISDGVFYPALHGLTHFCQTAVEGELQQAGERSDLLHQFWKAKTPYVFWRMPWVGYEYHKPEKPQVGFLPASRQRELIAEASGMFGDFFGRKPASGCAPGYRANADTIAAWSACGIKVAQNGPARSYPHLDHAEMLMLYRTLDFEPSHEVLPLAAYVDLAAQALTRGLPAIISAHSINFHSTLRDFRTPTLELLDRLLSALETKFPDLLYVHDEDVYNIVTQGRFRSRDGWVSVDAKQRGSEQQLATRGAS